MLYSQKFSDLLREAIGERRQIEVARAAGVQDAMISRALNWGVIPPREKAIRLADALSLKGRRRTEFLAAAGYVETEAVTA